MQSITDVFREVTGRLALGMNMSNLTITKMTSI